MKSIAALAAMASLVTVASPARDLQIDIDAGFFDDILSGSGPEFADLGTPFYDATPRAERRAAYRGWGSGGKAYAYSKGRSKDARKARKITRQSKR